MHGYMERGMVHGFTPTQKKQSSPAGTRKFKAAFYNQKCEDSACMKKAAT